MRKILIKFWKKRNGVIGGKTNGELGDQLKAIAIFLNVTSQAHDIPVERLVNYIAERAKIPYEI